MQKISSITATATPDGLFTNGSVATGVSPTILDAEWFNTIQNELVAVVQAGGLALDPDNDSQVLAALKKLFLQRSNPFGDIAADGAAAITLALNNLGLGSGSSLPVGVPIPWATETPPTGWIKCNGASFSPTYTQLAKVYPSLKVPDLRAEFIRGWDDGRGVDSGRSLLSWQHETVIQTAIETNSTQTMVGVDYEDSFVTGANLAVGPINFTGNSPRNKKGVRPRNVAFNYIVRAA